MWVVPSRFIKLQDLLINDFYKAHDIWHNFIRFWSRSIPKTQSIIKIWESWRHGPTTTNHIHMSPFFCHKCKIVFSCYAAILACYLNSSKSPYPHVQNTRAHTHKFLKLKPWEFFYVHYSSSPSLWRPSPPPTTPQPQTPPSSSVRVAKPHNIQKCATNLYPATPAPCNKTRLG